MPTGETRSMIWGRTESDKQTESMLVEHSLDKNSAIDIEILAEKVSEEQLWSGILVAIFADGSRRERQVEGVTLTSFLDMISPSYSEPHRIKQQSAPAQEMTSLSQSQERKKDKEEDLRLEPETKTVPQSSAAFTTFKVNHFLFSLIPVLLQIKLL